MLKSLAPRNTFLVHFILILVLRLSGIDVYIKKDLQGSTTGFKPSLLQKREGVLSNK